MANILFALIAAILVQICVAGSVEQVQQIPGRSNLEQPSEAPDGTVRTMPGSQIDKTAKLGKNVFIGYNALIGAEAEVGDNVIVLSGSVIPPKCQVPNNRIVINGPFTADLVFLLHDLERINPAYRKQYQSSVDIILKEKNLNTKIEEKTLNIFKELLKNPATFVKSGDLYVVLRAYLQNLYDVKLDEMLTNKNIDQSVFEKEGTSTIHFQRNPTNDDENKRNYLSKKLFAIFYVYMSPVTESLNGFKILADIIINDNIKIVTAQELAQDMSVGKSESVLNAEKLLANIQRGTLVGGGLISGWLGGSKSSASAESSASSFASSSSLSKASSEVTAVKSGGFFSGIFGNKKEKAQSTAEQKTGFISGLIGGYQSSGLSGWFKGKKQNSFSSAASAVANMESASSHSVGFKTLNHSPHMTAEHAKYFIEEHGYPCFQYCPYCGGDFVALLQKTSTKYSMNSRTTGSHYHGDGQTERSSSFHGDVHRVKTVSGDEFNGHSEHFEHRKTNGGSMTTISKESHSTSGGHLHDQHGSPRASATSAAVLSASSCSANDDYVNSRSESCGSSDAIEKERWEKHIMNQRIQDERYRMSGQTASQGSSISASVATGAATLASSTSNGVTGMHGHRYNQGGYSQDASATVLAASSTIAENSQSGHFERKQSLPLTAGASSVADALSSANAGSVAGALSSANAGSVAGALGSANAGSVAGAFSSANAGSVAGAFSSANAASEADAFSSANSRSAAGAFTSANSASEASASSSSSSSSSGSVGFGQNSIVGSNAFAEASAGASAGAF